MKATEISEIAIGRANCSWVVNDAKMLEALFSYGSERMIVLNRTRVLSTIDTMMNSLNELKLYIEELEG